MPQLGWSKCFVYDQKFIFILCGQNFLSRTKCKSICGINQKLWISTKHFETCRMLCPSTTGPKIFWAGPNQKLIHILCQSQTFCARPKDDLPLVIFWSSSRSNSIFRSGPKKLDRPKTFLDL